MTKYLLLAFLLALGSQAIDADEWYVGAGLGGSNATGSPDHAREGPNGTERADDWDTVLSLLGGYQFNRYLAGEVSYDRLGEFDERTRSFTFGGERGFERDDVGDVNAAAVLAVPLYRRFSLYGRAGVASAFDMETCRIAGEWCRSHSNWKGVPDLGVGGEWNIYLNSSLRLEADRLNAVGDNEREFTAGDFLTYKLEYLWRF